MINIYEWLNHEKSRYYRIIVQKVDINGIIINHVWGGCASNRGGKKDLFVSTEEEANKIIYKMMKRRKSRGYELISTGHNSVCH